jgi:hypothetical protein
MIGTQEKKTRGASAIVEEIHFLFQSDVLVMLEGKLYVARDLVGRFGDFFNFKPGRVEV